MSVPLFTAPSSFPNLSKCDRFLIATALTHALPGVTADKNFAECGVETVI